MKLWMLLQKLFYPMLNISRKRNFLLMFFTNPLGWGVRDGERIRMVFNGPPSIYIQSPYLYSSPVLHVQSYPVYLLIANEHYHGWKHPYFICAVTEFLYSARMPKLKFKSWMDSNQSTSTYITAVQSSSAPCNFTTLYSIYVASWKLMC